MKISFGDYSYTSVHEMIGNGFGIGTIKYMFGFISK